MQSTHNDSDIRPLSQGLYWEDLAVGQRFRTIRRTIAEADLVTFVGLSGMFVEGFLNGASGSGPLQGRLVPGALTYSMIEGLIVPTMLSGTGLALIECHQVMHKPVHVGDTISAIVEITDVRPTREHRRAIVGSCIRISNERGENVLTYETKRLLAGRPAS